MPVPNWADPQWQDIVAASEITPTLWNDFKDDIMGQFDPSTTGIDTDNIPDAGIDEAKVDGEAVTKDDPSTGSTEQVLTRETRTTGRVTLGGELGKKYVAVSASATPDSDGAETLVLENNTAGSLNITSIINGFEGQELTLILTGADNIVLKNDNTGGAIGAVADELFLHQNGDITYNAASMEALVVKIRLTKFGGTERYTGGAWSTAATNAVWIQMTQPVEIYQ